jgi:hypothetical protein
MVAWGWRVVIWLLASLTISQPVVNGQQCAHDQLSPLSKSGDATTSENPTALVVWAKTFDDESPFPDWAPELARTLSDFYDVMSYGNYRITTRVLPAGNSFYRSAPGHTIDFYKEEYKKNIKAYVGPWGVFVEEILTTIETEQGSDYFDDVDVIIMMVTDGNKGWYLASGNYSGIAYLGVDYVTKNGKKFSRYSGGITNEYNLGRKSTEWNICHEYGHRLGLRHRPSNYGTYALMYEVIGNELKPLCIQNIIDLGWLDPNDDTRVRTVSTNQTDFRLPPVRRREGVVAAKVISPDGSHFFINNHRKPDNPYDAAYPGEGMLIWHMNPPLADLECAVGLDTTTFGPNMDHLDLSYPDKDYYGEGLATDFWNSKVKSGFTPWSNPNSDDDEGNPTGVAITNIREENGEMLFDVRYDYTIEEALAEDNVDNPGDDNGEENLTRIGRADGTGESFSLKVFPNPFNPATQIVYALPHDGEVSIRIFNLLGRQIRELFQGFQQHGDYILDWDAREENGKTVAPGLYVVRLVFGRQVHSIKMLHIK